jgi:hypothetical protein
VEGSAPGEPLCWAPQTRYDLLPDARELRPRLSIAIPTAYENRNVANPIRACFVIR